MNHAHFKAVMRKRLTYQKALEGLKNNFRYMRILGKRTVFGFLPTTHRTSSPGESSPTMGCSPAGQGAGSHGCPPFSLRPKLVKAALLQAPKHRGTWWREGRGGEGGDGGDTITLP